MLCIVIAGATIGLAVIAALYEALKMLREVLMAMTLRRVEQDALEGHKNPPRNEQQAQENAASDRKQFIRYFTRSTNFMVFRRGFRIFQ